MLMAALQKGHFGKGPLQEKSQEEREQQENTKGKKTRNTVKAR